MKSLCACILVSLCAACSAQAASSPLDGLSALRDFRAMRSSSVDPIFNADDDYRGMPPGSALTIADLKGPGRISHIWFTIASPERSYGKLLVLRIYWDGEQNPSVECPINDFFCQGHGLDVDVNSLPVRVSSEGRARNCYWPMPFAKSARITVTNEGRQNVFSIYWHVDWQQIDKLPKDSAYFHALYRQEFPCAKGRDYTILDAKGRGHYVGCNLSVRTREDGWWGEGDDRFYIDGEKTPSIQGTGTEDYFCDAWGMHKAEGLYYGFPIVGELKPNERTTAYRFHIQDPVPFTKSLRVEIEHTGGYNGCIERHDDYSSVAYWYQTEPHKPFPKLPSAADRLYEKTIVIDDSQLLLEAYASPGKPARLPMDWCYKGAVLYYGPEKTPASLTVKFRATEAGRYTIRAYCTTSSDYGIYQAYVDGAQAGNEFDLFTEELLPSRSIDLTTTELAAGTHEIRFEATGRNPAASAYSIGLDYIELLRLE